MASSLLSVALVTVFKTAMEGKRPELAAPALPLEASLPGGARVGEELVRRLFEPLGYAVAVDAGRSTSGARRYVVAAAAGDGAAVGAAHAPVRAAAGARRREALLGRRLRGREAAAARRRAGCRAHPERTLIARRYLKHERRLYNPLLATSSCRVEEPREEALEERVSLRDQRLGSVQAVLKASGARRVLDLGCGPGALLERLARDGYEAVTGVDVSPRALEIAERRLRLDDARPRGSRCSRAR